MRFGCSLLATCVLLGAGAPARAESKVAFVGLEGLGLETSVVHPFERLVQETVLDLVGGAVVTPTEVAATLTQPGLAHLQACGGDVDCLSDLGGILETPFVLYGSLTQLGDNYVISLRLIDIETGKVGRGKQQLAGEQKILIQKLRELVTKLLDPERFTGALIVASNVAGASAALDGEPLALTGEATPVSAGNHTLTIEAAGYRTLSTLVEVRFGETARVDAVLQPTGMVVVGDATRLLPVAGMSLGGAGVVAGGTLGFLTLRKEQQVEDNYLAGLKGEKYYSRQDKDGRTWALWTNITLGVGGALLTAGLVSWLLADDAPEAVAP